MRLFFLFGGALAVYAIVAALSFSLLHFVQPFGLHDPRLYSSARPFPRRGVLPPRFLALGLFSGMRFGGPYSPLWYGSMLASGLVMLPLVCWVWPERVTVIGQVLERRPGGLWRWLASGVIALACAGLLIFILVTTVWLSPVSLLVVAGVAFGAVLGSAAIAVALGEMLLDRAGVVADGNDVPAALGAILALTVIIIPFVGWLCGFVALAMSFGLSLATHFGSPIVREDVRM